MKLINRILGLLLISTTLSACMFHGGEQKHISTPTMGQELTDLKTAFDNGALSDAEYQAAREKVIHACTQANNGKC